MLGPHRIVSTPLAIPGGRVGQLDGENAAGVREGDAPRHQPQDALLKATLICAA
jgi:hypothetical protein